VPRHVARLVTRFVAPPVIDYSASRRLVVDYFAYGTRPGASAHRAARHAARRAARRQVLRLPQARRRLLRLRRASGWLGTSRGLSCGSSRRLSSTTSPRAGSSSTTSPLPCVRVPRHVARLVTRLVTRLVSPLVVDYSALRRLVVDYFASATSPGASARRAARRRLLRLAQTRRRLLRLRRASRCLGTSRDLSRGLSRRSSRCSSSTTPPRAGSSSTTSLTACVWVPPHVARLVMRLIAPFVIEYFTSRRLVIDYFAFAACPGASARCAARRRLLRLAQARR
jgi:hypothetical protein